MLCFLLVLTLPVLGSSQDVAPEPRSRNSGECEWVSLPICQTVSRSWVNFPNLMGHRSQLEIANSAAYKYLEDLPTYLYEATESLNNLDASIAHQSEQVQRCELQIYQVACAYLVPKCFYMDKIHVSSLPPCRSTCTEVRDRCEDILHSRGLEWPDFLDCESWVQCHLPTVCRHSADILAPHSRSGNVHLPIQINRRRKIPRVEFKHHSETAAKKVLTRLTRHCPDIMRMYTIGRSVKNKPLYVMEISDKPGIHEPLEPNVKYIGGIHGNEVLGREILLQLMQYICREWHLGNERIRNMVMNTRIHILHTMNPDGYSLAAAQGPERNGWLVGRFNTKGYDLNRQFPDLTKLMYINEAKFGPNNHLSIPRRYWKEHKQNNLPEVYAVIKWIENYDFLLSAQLHGGELVANYPYDVRRRTGRFYYDHYSPMHVYSRSPDDELFRHLASTYAENHGTMADPTLNNCDSHFGRKGGITNGAAWYTVNGGMQDFNYLYSNAFEILVELSCRKFLPASELPKEWVNNKEALLRYIEQAHLGIKGFVRDDDGTPINGAIIRVRGILHDITTNKNGEYWRMLVPGKYTVTATKGEISQTKWIIVENDRLTAARYDFVLSIPSDRRPKPTAESTATDETSRTTTSTENLQAKLEENAETPSPKFAHVGIKHTNEIPDLPTQTSNASVDSDPNYSGGSGAITDAPGTRAGDDDKAILEEDSDSVGSIVHEITGEFDNQRNDENDDFNVDPVVTTPLIPHNAIVGVFSEGNPKSEHTNSNLRDSKDDRNSGLDDPPVTSSGDDKNPNRPPQHNSETWILSEENSPPRTGERDQRRNSLKETQRTRMR